MVKTASGVRRRHFMDPATGMYRGKEIIAVGKDVVETPTKKTAPKKKEATKTKETK